MDTRIAGVIYILITFAFVNEMLINVYARDNNKRRTKDKTGGFQKNICDVTDRDSKVHCYCENTKELKNATKAECWVFNGGIQSDDFIWHSFVSQPALQALSFNIRVDGALDYIPTKALLSLQYLKSINIKYGNIAEIASFAFANITNLEEINLPQNQIETLQQYSFAYLPNIITINLEDNTIIDIDVEAFIGLTKVKKIMLTKNNITVLTNGTFRHTFNLLELDLNRNNILSLNRRTFDGLANLKKLDLKNNRIQNLTEYTFAELWNLQELLLGKNELTWMSERAFDGLSQLRKLTLDNNKLISLPSGLFEGVRGLNSVDLRSNKLIAVTFDNIKPIWDNLKPQNSSLLLEGNNFECDCRLKWLQLLRNETNSQNTTNSFDKVTCEMNLHTVNFTANKILDVPNDINLVNKKYNPYASQTIDIFDGGLVNITEKKTIQEGAANDYNNKMIKKSVKRKVLQMSPNTLPCPKTIITSTERSSYFVDPVIPIQNEMKTYRFYEVKSGNMQYKPYVLVSVCAVFKLFLH